MKVNFTNDYKQSDLENTLELVSGFFNKEVSFIEYENVNIFDLSFFTNNKTIKQQEYKQFGHLKNATKEEVQSFMNSIRNNYIIEDTTNLPPLIVFNDIEVHDG
jgi:hypothetical protein